MHLAVDAEQKVKGFSGRFKFRLNNHTVIFKGLVLQLKDFCRWKFRVEDYLTIIRLMLGDYRLIFTETKLM